jgi:hypothetical protein
VLGAHLAGGLGMADWRRGRRCPMAEVRHEERAVLRLMGPRSVRVRRRFRRRLERPMRVRIVRKVLRKQ